MAPDKSILFFVGRFTVGGVERVTVMLAGAFARRGWHVDIAVLKVVNDDLLKQLPPNIHIHELGFPIWQFGKLRQLRYLMRESSPSMVINQWAFPFSVALLLRLLMPRGARLISVFHTMPGESRRINEASGLKRKLMIWAVRVNTWLVYAFSHSYVLLAECYIKVFEQFTGLHKLGKIYAIPNPVRLLPRGTSEKSNVILYVGRLSSTEKKVERVVETWRLLCTKMPDWRLDILGDGPDRRGLEELAKGLPRIKFYGFQDPAAWYRKSKILLLTSDFEGFPMSVVEAMSNGCVPVVYDSFTTASEIVRPEAGVVVARPWEPVRFADAVYKLSASGIRLEKMSADATRSVERFAISHVTDLYLGLMK